MREPAAKSKRSLPCTHQNPLRPFAAEQKTMITRVEIDGFKSFSQFAIDLKPLHVLIGPNGGGKSNLFEALHFLSTLVTRGGEAAKGVPVRGALSDLFKKTPDVFRKTPNGPVDEIRFAVEMVVTGIALQAEENGTKENSKRLRYEVVLRTKPDQQKLEFESEIASLSFSPEQVSAEHKALVRLPGAAFQEAPKRSSLEMPETDVPSGFQIAYDLRKLKTSRFNTYLSAFLDDENQSIYGDLYRALSRIQVAPFSADALRRAAAPATLTGPPPYSYSIPEALHEIQKNPSFNLRTVRRALLSLIPDVNGLRVNYDSYDDRYTAYVEWVDGTETAFPHLSDGTLRALAVVTVAHDRERDGLVMVEEPENGVHPGRLKKLTKYYRRLAQPQGRRMARQCLVSTHSPILLKYLMQGEEEESPDVDAYTEPPGITLITTALRSNEGRVSVGLTVDPTMKYKDRSRERAGEVHAYTQLIKYLEEGDLHGLVNDIKSSFEPEIA